MIESEIKDRILRLLTNENLSSSKFAEIVGVQRSSISHILSGRNKPSLDFLQKVLSSFPSINSDWLIIGKGEMFKNLRQTEISFNNKTEQSVPKKEENIEKKETQPADNKPIETVTPTKKRRITKVVVFYDDNTFEQLSPEKPLIGN